MPDVTATMGGSLHVRDLPADRGRSLSKRAVTGGPHNNDGRLERYAVELPVPFQKIADPDETSSSLEYRYPVPEPEAAPTFLISVAAGTMFGIAAGLVAWLENLGWFAVLGFYCSIGSAVTLGAEVAFALLSFERSDSDDS